jgi:hypothetical protein
MTESEKAFFAMFYHALQQYIDTSMPPSYARGQYGEFEYTIPRVNTNNALPTLHPYFVNITHAPKQEDNIKRYRLLIYTNIKPRYNQILFQSSFRAIDAEHVVPQIMSTITWLNSPAYHALQNEQQEREHLIKEFLMKRIEEKETTCIELPVINEQPSNELNGWRSNALFDRVSRIFQ